MGVAASSRPWTLEELHMLPDDGNKYELVRGELFVTPPPSVDHEYIGARLARILVPYVERNRLGHVMHPRSVVRLEGSEVEPDLMVRAAPAPGESDWERIPLPILIVEVLSPTTRRRDLNQKKSFYLDAGVAEYWVVDPDSRSITVVRAETSRVVREGDILTWTPVGDADPLTFRVAELFSVANDRPS
jgi:Uma2 family endonuclease